MELCSKLVNDINSGKFDDTFAFLYPANNPDDCRKRYKDLLNLFIRDFGDVPAAIISAPGRTEVGGNHTDHQHGNVLAASVNLDTVCVAAPNGEPVIRVQSVGYPQDQIDLNDLEKREDEKNTSAALIRGVAKWFSGHGTDVGGFNAYTTSNVLGGSGLSSSAAFEVAVGTTMSHFFDKAKTPVDIAMAGQYAENEYFGKPSGLLDQITSSVGGFVQVDFNNPKAPKIRPISFNLRDYGYNLCIIDTKGSHAGLTDEYAAITSEMRDVAKCFNKEYLREVDENDFYANIVRLRHSVSDRAALRAIHFFRDNALAVQSADALEAGDMEQFLKNVVRSGRSSFMCLQNVFSAKAPCEQGLTLALDLCERLLDGKGAWRVHGGGFAGTVQAFVPDDLLELFRKEQDALFGNGSCHVLSIRPVGGTEVTPNLKEEFTNGRA